LLAKPPDFHNKKDMKNGKKAFLLIEALLVLVIIGLLAAVFIPASLKIRRDAREGVIAAQVGKIIAAGQLYNSDKGAVTVDYKTLVNTNYLPKLESVDGESYDGVSVSTSGGKITVSTPSGSVVEKKY